MDWKINVEKNVREYVESSIPVDIIDFGKCITVTGFSILLIRPHI